MFVLLIVGILLLLFGGVVLLKFPNKPGGRIAMGTLEISSVGAGLPLIVLGVICLFAYTGAGTGVLGFWPFRSTEPVSTATAAGALPTPNSSTRATPRRSSAKCRSKNRSSGAAPNAASFPIS